MKAIFKFNLNMGSRRTTGTGHGSENGRGRGGGGRGRGGRGAEEGHVYPHFLASPFAVVDKIAQAWFQSM